MKAFQNLRGSKALDVVHVLFLATSAVHNAINVLTHETGFVALFGIAGILAVELTLWGCYTGWKDESFLGSQKRKALQAACVAWAYATFGLIISMGGGAGLAVFYFSYIMPTAAPVMFALVWRVIGASPERLESEESKLEAIAERRYITQDKRLHRHLREKTRSRYHRALMRRAEGIGTYWKLSRKAKTEYTELLNNFELTTGNVSQLVEPVEAEQLELAASGDGQPAKKLPGNG